MGGANKPYPESGIWFWAFGKKIGIVSLTIIPRLENDVRCIRSPWKGARKTWCEGGLDEGDFLSVTNGDCDNGISYVYLV